MHTCAVERDIHEELIHSCFGRLRATTKVEELVRRVSTQVSER